MNFTEVSRYAVARELAFQLIKSPVPDGLGIYGRADFGQGCTFIDIAKMFFSKECSVNTSQVLITRGGDVMLCESGPVQDD